MLFQDAVGEMISELKSGFKVRINQQDWMDEFTRERAKEKASTVQHHFLFVKHNVCCFCIIYAHKNF